MNCKRVLIHLEKKLCRCAEYCFGFSERKRGPLCQVTLKLRGPTRKEKPDISYSKGSSFPVGEYSEERLRMELVAAVLRAVRYLDGVIHDKETLGQYLTEERCETIRQHWDWAIDTAKDYERILHTVFADVLELPWGDIIAADINRAVEERCNHRAKGYSEATIRGWYKVIGRYFVYMESALVGFRSPLRMDGKKFREAQKDAEQKKAKRRISQRALTPKQTCVMLFAYLYDIWRGDYRGISGLMMQESGLRPIESGSTTLGMYQQIGEESVLSAWTYEVKSGLIVDEHKNGRSRRKLPLSPVMEVVYRYYKERMMAEESVRDGELDWREIPFGGEPVSENGRLIRVRPFSSSEISAYVKRRMAENEIDLRVAVEDAEEDTNDNRRAYVERYTAATNLYYFLALDVYQYCMAHRRGDTAGNQEIHKNDRGYYESPQVQREIYEGMKACNEAVYGPNIVQKVKLFLEDEEM